MSSSIPVTVVFDIGKTNKKFLLFDKGFSVIEKHQAVLEQTEDDDGDPCEDLEKLESWINEQIAGALENKKIKIQALNFSTYGASFVHLDQKGKAATPLYNYLKPYPKEMLSEFYDNVGSKEEFSLETASPPMGMLNSGLQLYWLKHQKPELFEKIDCSLHFPQYLSYLFTQEKTSELTSIGCHTGLWNFKKKEYHNWLKKKELQRLLPSIQTVSRTFENDQIKRIGLGIHDSSAALAPYLLALDEPFLLVSTGTWSITLNPFNPEPLTYDELERDCLCYLDIHGNQVKASRLFLGSEYDHQKKKIEDFFGVSIHEDEMKLDVSLLNGLVQKRDSKVKLQLEKAYNSGPYPKDYAGDWQIHRFASHKEAYHQLILDLVAIQAESIKLARGSEEVDQIIVTGGFSQNDSFVSLLASFFPDKRIYTSSLPDASALGAATVINNQTKQSIDILRDRLSLKLHPPLKGAKIERYSWKS